MSPYNDYSRAAFRDIGGNLDVLLTNELYVAHQVTGKYPAIMGLEFAAVEVSRPWNDWRRELVMQWHEMGGIVSFCWHWLIPLNAEALAKPFEDMRREDLGCWNTKFPDLDLKAAMEDPNNRYYQWILYTIDRAAEDLLALQAVGVPVLWRPLHEVAGGWFWWGTDREGYLKLWHLLYDRLVNVHGVHNLIWVWNAQDPDWYPGDDTVDILADDIYDPSAKDPACSRRFKLIRSASPSKMVGMSECNKAFDVDIAWSPEKNTRWQQFIFWDREQFLKSGSDGGIGGDGHVREFLEDNISAEDLRKLYNHELVLTLDEIQ